MSAIRSFSLALAMTFALVTVSPSTGQDKPKTDPQKPKAKALAGPLAELLKGSPEEFIKRFDKNTDGALTKEELPPRLADAMDRADRNNDGKLDKEEVGQLMAVLRKQFGQPQPESNQKEAVEQVVRKFLERWDTNKDGKLSKDEVTMGPLADNFAQLDANNDGVLDRDEIRKFAAKFAAKAGTPLKPRLEPRVEIPDFDALDQNADGRLTAEELKGTPHAAKLTAMDANKDGKLDRKEWEAYFRREAAKKEPPKKEE